MLNQHELPVLLVTILFLSLVVWMNWSQLTGN